MYNFSNFSTVDTVKCGREIRLLGAKAHTMEEVANEIVHFFYDNFVEDQNGSRSCVLVRLFKTHDYVALTDDLKTFAQKMLTQTRIVESCKCFTLLATCGANPEWESRANSKGHQAIPLPSIQVVERIPMMRNMVKQMGLEINSVVAPDPEIIVDLSQKAYNVFHVPHTEGSPYVPMQEEFVIPYGVKSVLGFGGVLPSGNVFVLIIFSKTPIAGEVANCFAPLALNVKMALLPFEEAVFARKAEVG
jgi:two-component system NtrC family sensor kinase